MFTQQARLEVAPSCSELGTQQLFTKCFGKFLGALVMCKEWARPLMEVKIPRGEKQGSHGRELTCKRPRLRPDCNALQRVAS